MKNTTAIIITTILFFIAGSWFISFSEVKKHDLSAQDTWMLYFNKPTDHSLDFTIENHSKATDFHWEILSGKNSVRSADISIERNMTRSIPIKLDIPVGEKITIRMSDGTGSKEIYKNF